MNSLFRVDCKHVVYTVRNTSTLYKYMALLCFVGYYAAMQCAHFRGLTSQHAAQCNEILISILLFPIKTTLHETFVACINSIQLSYLRICIYHFSWVPFPMFPFSHWFTDSVCMLCIVSLFAHTDTGIQHAIGHTVYV